MAVQIGSGLLINEGGNVLHASDGTRYAVVHNNTTSVYVYDVDSSSATLLETSTTNISIGFLSACIDSNDIIHIAIWNATKDGVLYDIQYATYNPSTDTFSSWEGVAYHQEAANQAGTAAYMAIDIQVDDHDYPWIVYSTAVKYKGSTVDYIMLTDRVSGSWSTSEAVNATPNKSHWHPRVLVQYYSSSSLHLINVMYVNGTDSLLLKRVKTNGTWGSETTIRSPGATTYQHAKASVTAATHSFNMAGTSYAVYDNASVVVTNGSQTSNCTVDTAIDSDSTMWLFYTYLSDVRAAYKTTSGSWTTYGTVATLSNVLKTRSGFCRESVGEAIDYVGFLYSDNSQTYYEEITLSTTTTISLSKASLTAAGKSLQVVPGAITKPLDTALLTATGQALTVINVTPPTTIPLDVAQLTATGQQLTFVPGLYTALLNKADLTANGQALTFVPGLYTALLAKGDLTAEAKTLTVITFTNILLNKASLTAEGKTLTFVPGTYTALLSKGDLTATGLTLTVSIGGTPQTIPLNVAQLTAEGKALQVIPGLYTALLAKADVTATGQTLTLSYTVLLGKADISATGQNLQVVPGLFTALLSKADVSANAQALTLSYTVLLGNAQLTAEGKTLSVVPGLFTASLSTAALTAQGRVLTVVLQGAISIPLARAQLTAEAKTVTLSYTTLLGVASVTANAQSFTVVTQTDILLDTAGLSAQGLQLDVVPGIYTTLLDKADVTATGRILTVVLGSVINIPLSRAQLVVNGQQLDLIPGPVSIPIDTALATAEARTLDVVPGLYTALLDVAQLVTNGQQLDVVTITSILLQTASLTAEGKQTNVIPGDVVLFLAVALLTAEGQQAFISIQPTEDVVGIFRHMVFRTFDAPFGG